MPLLHWLQVERHALRQDVTRAKSQLAEAQAARQAAQAAAHTSTEGLAALEHALSTARSAVFASPLHQKHLSASCPLTAQAPHHCQK